MDRKEYLAKVMNFIKAYKELQEYGDPNIPPAEFVENMYHMFDAFNYSFQVNEEEIHKILGYYLIYSDDTNEIKQKTWDNFSNHLQKITAITQHSFLINKCVLCFEKLATEMEHEPSIAKEIYLRSAEEELPEVTNFINRWTEIWKIPPSLTLRIHRATTEAVNNAILHGNLKDYTKKIEVTACKQGNKVTITVKDEGTGFDYMNIPATLPDAEQETGRGLFLIKNSTDKMTFEDNGSKIILSFIIQPDK